MREDERAAAKHLEPFIGEWTMELQEGDRQGPIR